MVFFISSHNSVYLLVYSSLLFLRDTANTAFLTLLYNKRSILWLLFSIVGYFAMSCLICIIRYGSLEDQKMKNPLLSETNRHQQRFGSMCTNYGKLDFSCTFSSGYFFILCISLMDLLTPPFMLNSNTGF